MTDLAATSPRSIADRALGSRGILALAIGVAVLIALAAGSVLLAVRNAQALALANQTERARTAISDVITSVQDAETGQRGFLLTGREAYLQPYTLGVSRLPAQVEELNATLPVAAERRRMVIDLEAAIDKKMAELRRTLDLAQIGEPEEAVGLVKTDLGLQAMNDIRTVAKQIADEEEAIYERQVARVIEGGRILVIADAAGLLLVLVLALFAGRSVRRYLLQLREARAGLGVANGMLAGANAKLAQANGELESRVLARTADLTEANNEIQRFAYIVSHDLRSPLVNILGFTGELESATRRLSEFVIRSTARHPEEATEDVQLAVTEDLPEAIRFIRASSSKMDRLIAAILRLSREGQRLLVPERIEMKPFLQGIVDSLRHQAAESGTTIELGGTPDLFADRLVAEQIFSNLVENALKYPKPGRPGEIRVEGGIRGSRTEYSVIDNGRGIAAGDKERVFELFRRAGKQDVAGEGIGLAHVRALVRRLGGTIDCESTVDVGSTFRAMLPLAAARGGPDPVQGS